MPTSTLNLECYREWLPEWPQLQPEGPGIDEKALRRILLAGDEAADPGIAPMVPPEVMGYLAAWAKLPHYGDMVEELPDGKLAQVRGAADAAEAPWVAAGELQGMEEQFFEDHFQVLDHFFRFA